MSGPNIEKPTNNITEGDVRIQESIVDARAEDFGAALAGYRNYLRPLLDILSPRIARPSVEQTARQTGDALHQVVVAEATLTARRNALGHTPVLGSVSDESRDQEYQHQLALATAGSLERTERRIADSLVASSNGLREPGVAYQAWLRNYPARGAIGLGMIGLWAIGNGIEGPAAYPVLREVYTLISNTPVLSYTQSLLREASPVLRIGGEFLALSGALDGLRVHGEGYFRRHAHTAGAGIKTLTSRLASAIELRITHGERFPSMDEYALRYAKTRRVKEIAEGQTQAANAGVPTFAASRSTGVIESNQAINDTLAEARFTDALIEEAGRQRLLRLLTAVGLVVGMTGAEAAFYIHNHQPSPASQVGRMIDSYPHSDPRPDLKPEEPIQGPVYPGPVRPVTVLTGPDATFGAETGNVGISSLKGFIEAKIIADQIMPLSLGHEFNPHSANDLAEYEAEYAKDPEYYGRAIKLAARKMREANEGQNNSIGDWVVHFKEIYGLTEEEVQQIAGMAKHGPATGLVK